MAYSERTVSVIEESFEAQQLSTTYEERSVEWTVVCSNLETSGDVVPVTMTLPVSDLQIVSETEHSADVSVR